MPWLETHVSSTQKTPVVTTHQSGRVRPRLNKAMIESAFVQQEVRDPHGERCIAARPHAKPDICLLGESCFPRINNKELRPGTPSLSDCMGLGQPGIRRVMAPQHDKPRMCVVRCRHTTAEGEHVGKIFVPVTNFGGVAGIGAAVPTNQTFNPIDTVAQGSSAGRRYTKGKGLCAATRFDIGHAASNFIQRFVPGNLNPAWVCGTLGLRAAHGMAEPVRVIDQFRSSFAFQAHGLTRWMLGVGTNCDQVIALNFVQGAAPGST
ncbi:hypothetical protein D3C85_1069670 [compost metagenome]